MNVMLFLGSGISLPSQLPGTDEITDSLLKGKWFAADTARAFYPCNSINPEPNELVKRIQALLNALKDCIDEYNVMTKRNGTCTYEDLYYLARQIVDEESQEIDNPVMRDFTQKIRSKVRNLCRPLSHPDGTFIPHTYISFRDLAEQSCSFIRWGICHLLKDDRT